MRETKKGLPVWPSTSIRLSHETTWFQLAGIQGGLADAQVAAATADLFARNDPQVLAAIARGLPPLWRISREDLRTTTVPVLAIIGEYDRNNLEAVKRMASVISGLQVVQLPGASHATSVRPAAEHIVAFLNKHRRS